MSETVIDPKKIYTVLEVSELTNAGRFNILRWIKSGKLPAMRKAGMFLVYGSDIIDTLAKAKAGEIKLEAPWSNPIKQLAMAR